MASWNKDSEAYEKIRGWLAPRTDEVFDPKGRHQVAFDPPVIPL